MKTTHIDGIDKGKVLIFTLSTCGWCKKIKAYLKEHKIAFDYIDVDLLQNDERESILIEMRKWNPRTSFPTIVVDNKRCITGYDEKEMTKEFKL